MLDTPDRAKVHLCGIRAKNRTLWDNRWLNTFGSTQKTYSYQNFFGSRILCCLNTFLLLCTQQAQKLLNFSKHTPSKMRVSARAVHATVTKKNIFMYRSIPSTWGLLIFTRKSKLASVKHFEYSKFSKKANFFAFLSIFAKIPLLA